VQLIPCNRPLGSLESAPRTSLRADTTHERLQGFWSVEDDAYYARCECADGAERWFRIADAGTESVVDADRVIPLRVRDREFPITRRMLLLTPSGQRPILVGGSRRRVRTQPQGNAGGRG
jgi:hypothetical protein